MHSDQPPAPQGTHEPLRVVWAGTNEAQRLASQLSGATASKAQSNLVQSCIESRASLLVLSKRTSFRLCSFAIPHGVNLDTTRSVVAAIGGGPHSALAAELADRLAKSLSVPASAVCGYSNPEEISRAEAVADAMAVRLPHLDTRIVEASSPAEMVGALPNNTLLVVGAPGGSWFQRRFFGPGPRIQAKAPGGTIIVNHNPDRVYQVMRAPVAYGPHMRVADAVAVAKGLDVTVAEDGTLIGTVTHEHLASAAPDAELHMIASDAAFLSAEDEIEEAIDLLDSISIRSIPVVDGRARLIGSVSASDLRSSPTTSL
jgi:CBS domain-containing protein